MKLEGKAWRRSARGMCKFWLRIIERLKKPCDELQDDRSSLQDDFHDMKDAWLQSGVRDGR